MREFPFRKIKEAPRAAFVVSDRVRTVALQDELPLKFKYQSVNIHASGYKCEWQR